MSSCLYLCPSPLSVCRCAILYVYMLFMSPCRDCCLPLPIPYLVASFDSVSVYAILPLVPDSLSPTFVVYWCDCSCRYAIMCVLLQSFMHACRSVCQVALPQCSLCDDSILHAIPDFRPSCLPSCMCPRRYVCAHLFMHVCFSWPSPHLCVSVCLPACIPLWIQSCTSSMPAVRI